MSEIKTNVFAGDVSVGRNVFAGGDAKISGDASIGHNLVVKGWLDARNVKHANKGMFLSASRLSEVYPSPRDGWWALVGDSLPAAIYVACDGEWVSTGKSGGEITIDVEQYWSALTSVREELALVRESVSDAKSSAVAEANAYSDAAVRDAKSSAVAEAKELDSAVLAEANAYSDAAVRDAKSSAVAEAKELDSAVLAKANAYSDAAVGKVDLSGYATKESVSGVFDDLWGDDVEKLTLEGVGDVGYAIGLKRYGQAKSERSFVLSVVDSEFPGLMSVADKAKLDAMHSFEERLSSIEAVVASISTTGVEARVRALEDVLSIGGD